MRTAALHTARGAGRRPPAFGGRRRGAHAGSRPRQLYGRRGARAALAAGDDAAGAAGPAGPALDAAAARGLAGLISRAVSLKGVPRQGWIDKAGISRPESVADHSYGTALAAMAAGDALGMDTLRMVRMALLHDLAESITGDIVPGAVPAGEKAGIEGAAMAEILGGIPGPLRGAYGDAWAEFEEGRTAEAAMVRELDKIEMAAQAAAYSGAGGGVGGGGAEGLAEISESARRAVSSRAGAALLGEVEGGGGGGGRMRAGGRVRRTAGPEPDGRDETIEAQKAVIGILFEVVKRLQANSDLDGEYMRIAASGRAADRGERLGEIAAERGENAEAAARLLRQLEQ